MILPVTFFRPLDLTNKSVLERKATLDPPGRGTERRDPGRRPGRISATPRGSRSETSVRRSENSNSASRSWTLDGLSPNVQDVLDNFEFQPLSQLRGRP